MVLDDHINKLGCSALTGHQHLLNTPFIDMGNIYQSPLRDSFVKSAETADIEMYNGVYCAMPGPQFETPTEARYLHSLGADAVGMSTVLEATTAHALGAQVMAVSVVINRAKSPEHKKKVDGVEASGKRAKKQLLKQIHDWLQQDDIPLI